MVVPVLSEAQRQKLEEADDRLFYAQPRLVHHLDAPFRSRLTALYRSRLSAGSRLLDLMSSWVSHLPEEISFGCVHGHGLNETELQANSRLDQYWLQNLNQDTSLPLDDASIDAAMIVAGWQYLQHPEAVASELRRVIRPGGQLIISFSNRMFPQKATAAWLEASDHERLQTVAEVLIAQGWERPDCLAEPTRASGPLGWLGGQGDPFFAVIAER